MKKLSLSVLMLLGLYASFSQTLVAHWTFDNGNANDISGNNLHGVTSNTTTAAGKAGTPNTALQFNGINSKVDVAYNSLMNFEKFTISAVVKMTGFNAGKCQGNTVLGRMNGSRYAYHLIATDNYFDGSCDVQTPTANVFSANASGNATKVDTFWRYRPTINLNQWYCVTATYDKTEVRIYVDGVHMSTMPHTHTNSSSASPITIGYLDFAQFPYYFNGVIDDIELWNGVLTPQAIATKCASTGNEGKTCEIDDVSISYGAINTKAYSFKPVTKSTSGQIKWTFGDGSTQTLAATQSASHTYSGNGQYTVCAQIINGTEICEEKVCFDICIGNSLTVKETGQKPSSIGDPYPNPAASSIIVPVRTNNGKVSISIVSADGKTIQQKTETVPAGDQKIEMSIENMVPGIYLLDIREGDQRRTKTFSKQ